MGGDRTNAERQRRYIARLKAQAKAGQELAAAKARITKLEAEVAKLKAARRAARSK
jgi:hypothetical protein